jgi:hypothetical protein
MPARIDSTAVLYRSRPSIAIVEKENDMVEGLRFLWNATRGHRLRPWRSAYLRWRLETYTGQSAETIEGRDFLRFAWDEKGQFLRFLRWTGEIRGYAASDKKN